MLRTFVRFAVLISTPFGALVAQDAVTPEPVPDDLISTAPFSHNGLITVNGGTASGSMVGEGVFVTAAHVVYNETFNQWLMPWHIRYYPQFNSINFLFGQPRFTPVALYRWADYSSRVQSDPSKEGFSSANTFNLDLAVGYFSAAYSNDVLIEHAELHIDQEGEVSIHRHPREKMIVGYPSHVEHVPEDNRGLMHRNAPGDYFAVDAPIDNEDLPEYDLGGVWASTYYFRDVIIHGGNSGGPIYVRDDMDNWMMAGAAVGGLETFSRTVIRSIDDNAWKGIGPEGMIEQAVIARNGAAMRRVEDLQADTSTGGSVYLQWSDLSTRESGYSVFRQETGIYEQLAELPENSSYFEDATAEPGKVYHYQVQPFRLLPSSEHINKSPKSPPLAVDVPGTHASASTYLEAGFLKLSSSGKSSWYVDHTNRLRAGVVRPLSSSSLYLDIIGPGTVTFDWSASCEVNEHYTNNDPQDPDSEYFGLIYDAIWLYLNGEQAVDDQEPVFLSGPLPNDPTGIISEPGVTIDLPEGAHRIEWRYEKDPYADDHQDTGFLDALTWTPDPDSPYPVYGGYQVSGTTWHAANWFGHYETSLWPWIAHEHLGWLYMLGSSPEKGTYFHIAHPDLGLLYTSPECWPYLYKSQTDNWIYFYADTGNFGYGTVFYDYAGDRFIKLAR